jgi:hypothetical protein
MTPTSNWARRYHWLSDDVKDFVNEPHSAIASQAPSTKSQAPIINMVASESKNNRKITAKVSHQNPEKTIKTIKKLQEATLPERHTVLVSDINPKNMKGVGPKTIRALSLISELVYSTPASTRDPARFSFAHGGKDGTPYPVDRKTYDQSINYLNQAIKKAKLGHYEKINALRRLHIFSTI